MPENFRLLYIWQAGYPWDVRVEKVCTALRDRGFSVEILARRKAGEPVQDTIDGVGIYRVSPSGPSFTNLPVPGNLLWHQAIRRRIQEFRPHLLIARDIPLALPTGHEAKRANLPWVIDMAEHYPEAMRTWKKYQSNPFMKFLINELRLPDRIERRSVSLADGILPVCEEQKERLLREYRATGLRAERILSVMNTPERNRFSHLPPRSPRGKVFGYHGVVIQDRDLLTVARGFDLAADRDPEISLVIAGDGESLPDLQKLVSQLKHRDRVRLPGRFKAQDQAQIYSEVDFGIVSWKVNVFTENTVANKFFDYAACGKPILYTATRPMTRLMRTMKCGRPFIGGDPRSVADAMIQLTCDDYDTLSRNGREAIASDLNWETDADRMSGFLKRLIETSPQASVRPKRNRSGSPSEPHLPEPNRS